MQLTEDIFYSLGEHVNSRVALASLCRVSKLFNKIFTPILYRRIDIQDCSPHVLANISELPEKTHLRFVTELNVGRNVFGEDDAKIYAFGIPTSYNNNWDDGVADPCEDDANILKKLVAKMPALETLMVLQSDFEIEEQASDQNGLLHYLATRGKLRRLAVTARNYWWEWPIPEFRSLRQLSLDGVAPRSTPRLADLLVASPELTHLDLCGVISNAPHDNELYHLVTSYHQKRMLASAPLLKLETLELGVGFLPQKSYNGREIDFSKLTNMSCLQSLSIWNYTGQEAYPSTFDCSNEYMPILYNAQNLVHLKVNMMTPPILEFIQYLRNANPVALTSLEIDDASWAEAGKADGQILVGFGPSEVFRDYPIYETGHHWHSLCIGNIFGPPGTEEFSAQILDCTELNYLCCNLPDDHLERFRVDILPNLTHLHTLLVKDGPFPTRFPTIVNPNPNGGVYRMDTVAASLKNIETHDAEAVRIAVAESLFAASWRAWEFRTDDTKGEKLKHVGLGFDIYVYMFPSPGETNDADKRRAVRLEREESMQFKDLRKLFGEEREYYL